MFSVLALCVLVTIDNGEHGYKGSLGGRLGLSQTFVFKSPQHSLLVRKYGDPG